MCKPMAFRAYALIVGFRKDKKVLTRVMVTISEMYQDLEKEKGLAVMGSGRVVEGYSCGVWVVTWKSHGWDG